MNNTKIVIIGSPEFTGHQEMLKVILASLNKYTSLTENKEISQKMSKEVEKPNEVKKVETKIINPQLALFNSLLESLAKKQNLNLKQLAFRLKIAEELSPGTLDKLVIREIAVQIDKKYSDNIRKNCKSEGNYYVLNPELRMTNPIPKKLIPHKTFQQIGFFRNAEDSEIGRIVFQKLQPILKQFIANGFNITKE